MSCLAPLILALQLGGASAPCACRLPEGVVDARQAIVSPRALEMRDFALFSHRRIADELVAGNGPYLDTVLAALPPCATRAHKLDWLRNQLQRHPDTSDFARQLARAAESTPRCAVPASADAS